MARSIWKYVSQQTNFNASDSFYRNGMVAGRAQKESCCLYLQHASKAVRQGRSFLRRLITRSTAVKHLDHYIRLDVAARSDVRWWSLFASHWNGTSHASTKPTPNSQSRPESGAFEGSKWIQFEWPAASHISIREMIHGGGSVGKRLVGKIGAVLVGQLGPH